ncbi:serine hydrolase domain-containing protein [Sphingomonas echinoides]|uniref:serine hydrolase domain-containing protein n=1 Tax=Sphingomonas echinoides TaxID=59803 RepID=UPI00241395D2|nr:serine hydrolase domain-containing protein [Sphingomonas echinoides]
MKLAHSWLATGLLLVAAPAAAQSLTPAETAQIDQTVTATLAKSGVPSASVAIVRGGQIVYAKAYGKQAETGTTRDEAPYQIASVSKQFTAAAILLLQREGKLSLDDHVSKYVSGITNGDTITIRQLLSHTSGLRDYWPQDYSFKAMATPVTPQQIVDRWAKTPLDFKPGTQWQYSNTGYVVAGMIVEKVSGKPLLDFLKARIFKPLGVTVYDQDLAVGPGFPQGYGRAALGPVRPVQPPARGWLYAAGELAMSARALATWDVARLDHTVLAPEDWATQETPVKLADGSTSGYGLGVSVGTPDGRRTIEHSGEAVGFLSENIVYPDQKAAIVVLTNTWSSNAYQTIAQKLAGIVLSPAATDPADAAALARVRRVFDQLRDGSLDRTMLTENANFYFTPTTLGDYRASLAPLGAPVAIVQNGKPRLRGGFVNRSYRVRYADATLSISTYAEPGTNGKLEQFIVAPTQ